MKVSLLELKQAVEYINKISRDMDIRIDIFAETLELTCSDLSSNLVVIKLFDSVTQKIRPKVHKVEELK